MTKRDWDNLQKKYINFPFDSSTLVNEKMSLSEAEWLIEEYHEDLKHCSNMAASYRAHLEG